ncbi:MAG: serine hydrolase domain-containing protein [Pseudomonadota bacterium]
MHHSSMVVRLRGALFTLFACIVSVTAASARTEFDAAKLEAWADEYFGTAVANNRINGASVGFIQDGQTLFLKAYGWQDQKEKVPLDPSQTRFRMCSTSKTVMATSLMQLVERGQIDSLDDPVNKYLKRYQLPPPYGGQVTFRQLMTHSSGMAGHATPQGTKKDLAVPLDSGAVQKFFRENIERKPGAVGQYANLGVALEGVALEDITGQTLAEYIRANIFQPLGMDSALFHHSLKKPPHLAQPYGVFPNGELQEVKFFPKHPLTAASGGFITTTEDMLKYVALHADEEAANFPDVLSSTGRKTLHSKQFGRHPSDPGIGLHFYRDTYGDELMVHHGCGLPGTRSLMGVFPNSNAGFVVTVLVSNTTPSVGNLVAKLFGKGRLIETEDGPSGKGANPNALPSAMLGERVRPPLSKGDISPEFVADHSKLAGTYWGERRSFNSYATLFAFDTTEVSFGEQEGELLIDKRVFERKAPGIYDAKEGNGRVVFRQLEPNGDIFFQPHVSLASRQVKGLRSPIVGYGGMAVSFALSLSGLFALAWRSRRRLEGYARSFAIGMAVCTLLMPIVFLAGYETVLDIAFIDYFNGDLARSTMLIALFNIHFLLGLCVIASAVVAWVRSAFGTGVTAVITKSHLSLLAFAAIAAWPAMVNFNLIGLQQ